MTGTAVEGTTDMCDAKLLRLIGEARSIMVSYEAVFDNHDETVETYKDMEKRAVADFLNPYTELEKEITLMPPVTREGLRAKAEFALDTNLMWANTPIFSSVVHHLAERETPPWSKLWGSGGMRFEYAGKDDDGRGGLFRLSEPPGKSAAA
jgi:hypothetical protein